MRRGEILEAAKRLFLQDGIQHVTMRRIAAKLGVSSTALHVHFPDKTAILNAIAEATFEALLVAHANSQDPCLPRLDRFRAGLMAYIELALSRPDECRLTFDAKAGSECSTVEAADRSFGTLRSNVAELMLAGIF